MQTNRLLSAAFFLGVAACGSAPIDGTGSSGTGGSEDSSSSSNSGGSSSSSTSSNSGGTGGGGACIVAATISLKVVVTPPASIPSATCGDVTTVNFDGKIRKQDGDIFVDTCHPNADCVPNEVKIHVSGSTFTSDDAKAIPDGTFVHVVWTAAPSIFTGSGCGDAVLLRNLPTWQNLANPTASHSSLWLFATNAAPLKAVGVDADRTALAVDEGVLCSTKDLEPSQSNWVKLGATDANVSVQVSPGLRAPLAIPSGAQKGDYSMLNDAVGVVGNFVKSYAIVRKAP
jgi:hypothetical protein